MTWAGSRSRRFPAAPATRAKSSVEVTGSPAAPSPRSYCAEFLKYIDSTSVQMQIAGASVGLPVNTAASGGVSVPAEKSVLTYYKNVSYLQTYFDVAFPVNVGNAIDAAIANYFAGQGTPQSIIQAVAKAARPSNPSDRGQNHMASGDRHRQCGTGSGAGMQLAVARSRSSIVDRPRHYGAAGPASRNLRKKLELVLLIGPALVLFVGFVLVPIGIAAQYSLYNWSGMSRLSDFIGLHNYRRRSTTPCSVAPYSTISCSPACPSSFSCRLRSERRSCSTAGCASSDIFRVVTFAPYVLSEATTAVIWLLMLQPGGFVDVLMHDVGLGGLVQTLAGQPAYRPLHAFSW